MEIKVDRSKVRTISVFWITKLKEIEVKENFGAEYLKEEIRWNTHTKGELKGNRGRHTTMGINLS
jgi:hypothetical protein